MGSVKGMHTVGGIVGKSSGTILNCVNNATVTGGDTVGGIAGALYYSSEFQQNKNAGLIQGNPTGGEVIFSCIGGIAG